MLPDLEDAALIGVQVVEGREGIAQDVVGVGQRHRLAAGEQLEQERPQDLGIATREGGCLEPIGPQPQNTQRSAVGRIASAALGLNPRALK